MDRTDQPPRQPRHSIARLPAIVRRSAPSPSAPPTGLPPDLDRIVRDADRERAVTYACAEDLAARADNLADDLDTNPAIAIDVDDDDDDSLVTSLDDLAQMVAAG